jgi:hypothetical protein
MKYVAVVVLKTMETHHPHLYDDNDDDDEITIPIMRGEEHDHTNVPFPNITESVWRRWNVGQWHDATES